jgi:hypothetical protein
VGRDVYERDIADSVEIHGTAVTGAVALVKEDILQLRDVIGTS